MSSNVNAATSGGLTMTSDTSGILKLQTAGTDAVTITAAQNVGIGTSSPSQKLSVAGAIASTNGSSIAVYGKTNSDSISNTFYLQNSDGNKAANLQLGTTGILQTWVYGGSSWVNATTIDSSGNLLVGGTSNVNINTSGGWYASPSVGNTYTMTSHVNGTPSTTRYNYFYYNNNEIGSITQNGTTAVAYNTTSDYRLKENVQPLSGALARVSALKPCTYTWKAAPEEIGEGFIAHELAKVCPQAVTGEKDAVNEDGSIKAQSIDTSFLVATLTAAIKEMKEIIDQQSERITALEGAAQ